MKRIALTLMAILIVAFPMFSQNVSIPDANFLAALIRAGDTNDDGQISHEEAEAVTNMNVASNEISDLTGIEAFTNLTHLYCDINSITILDVSKNTKLEYLDCSRNQLATIDISNCTNLKNFSCASNLLTSLDLTSNTKLITLYCGWNSLINLDISMNIEL